VRNIGAAQLVLVDTPGLHRPTGRHRSRLNQFMVDEAKNVMSEVDALVVVEDATAAQPNGPAWSYLMEELAGLNKPKILALNKVDIIGNKSRLLPLIQRFAAAFSVMVPISARSGDGVGLLLEEIIKLLPVGPPLYPADTLTDRPERFLAAGLIREQVFLNMREDIPYAVAVSIDTWEENPKAVKIAAT